MGFLDQLVRRPSIRHRNGVGYLTLRAWAADSKPANLAEFKAEKIAKTAKTLDVAAAEVADEVVSLLGSVNGWCVACVACGHSQDPECWGKLLARRVADRLGSPFLQVFQDRFVSGSSHPKEFKKLGPLKWAARPSQPVILVDDVATSGWHLEEALALLREVGPAFAAAWIGGNVSNKNGARKKELTVTNPFRSQHRMD